MAVTYRSSSSTGDAVWDPSCAIPVPAGAAALDIALVALGRWETAINPAVTPPSGFAAAMPQMIQADMKLDVYWKRLSGADSGNYTFSWTGNMWNAGQCILIDGGMETGDPIAAYHSAGANSATIQDLSVTTVVEAFLAHFVGHEQPSSGTPPGGFTEIQDINTLKTNYLIPGAIGTHIASGGTISNPTDYCTALVAISPPAVVPAVDIGVDSWTVVGGTFGRVAQETDGGSPIVAREWMVISGPEDAGNVVGDQIMCTWAPTAAGSYVLRYTATNGVGASFDEINLEAGAGAEGPENSLMKR